MDSKKGYIKHKDSARPEKYEPKVSTDIGFEETVRLALRFSPTKKGKGK